MIRSRTRRGAITAATAVSLSLLTGCSGFLSDDMTVISGNPAAGSNAKAGPMLVRNAFVLGPEPGGKISRGEGAALYLVLYTKGQSDRLIGASSRRAADVRIPGGSIPVPSRELIQTSDLGAPLTLTGLAQPLQGGESVPLTLQFERAGTLRFHVPVFPRSGPYESLSPAPTSSPATSVPARTGSPVPTAGTPSPAG